MIIYKVTNKLNNKSYIGLTTRTLQERKLEHLRHLIDEDTYFHRAIKKYGAENFEWIIIDNSAQSNTELQYQEKYYIEKYNTLIPNGYNMTIGGELTNIKNRRDYSGGNNPAAKPVINLTTMKVYDCVLDASKDYKVSAESIRKSIKNHQACKNCVWDYYNANKEYEQTIPSKETSCRKAVKNTETQEIFTTISAAAEKYHVARKTIRESCNKSKHGIWEFVY